LSINKNQQVYDLTSNPDSPTKCKRQKTISECQNMTNLINDDIDDIDDNDVIITYIKSLPLKPCVMFCGFTTDDKEILKMVFCLLVFFLLLLYNIKSVVIFRYYFYSAVQ